MNTSQIRSNLLSTVVLGVTRAKSSVYSKVFAAVLAIWQPSHALFCKLFRLSVYIMNECGLKTDPCLKLLSILHTFESSPAHLILRDCCMYHTFSILSRYDGTCLFISLVNDL